MAKSPSPRGHANEKLKQSEISSAVRKQNHPGGINTPTKKCPVERVYPFHKGTKSSAAGFGA